MPQLRVSFNIIFNIINGLLCRRCLVSLLAGAWLSSLAIDRFLIELTEGSIDAKGRVEVPPRSGFHDRLWDVGSFGNLEGSEAPRGSKRTFGRMSIRRSPHMDQNRMALLKARILCQPGIINICL